MMERVTKSPSGNRRILILFMALLVCAGLSVFCFRKAKGKKYSLGDTRLYEILPEEEKKDGFAARFPDIIETDRGLLAAYYWNREDCHAPEGPEDPPGTIRLIRCDRNGVPCSEPEDLINEGFLADHGLGLWVDDSGFYRSPDSVPDQATFCVEARDPNFTRLRDGTILFTFFTRLIRDDEGEEHSSRGTAEKPVYSYGKTYLMLSRDEGNTWTDPQEIPCEYLSRGCAKRGNVAVYPDGKLLIPLYGFHDASEKVFTTANVYAEIKDDSIIVEQEYAAHDHEGGTVTAGAFEEGVTEVSLIAEGGRTYAFCRGTNNVLCSEDRGKSWRILPRTENKNIVQPSFCSMDGTEQIFASWAEHFEGGRDVYAYVYDPGQDQWEYDHKKLLFRSGQAGDMGDPKSIVVNGALYTVFYSVPDHFMGMAVTELCEQ